MQYSFVVFIVFVVSVCSLLLSHLFLHLINVIIGNLLTVFTALSANKLDFIVTVSQCISLLFVFVLHLQ